MHFKPLDLKTFIITPVACLLLLGCSQPTQSEGDEAIAPPAMQFETAVNRDAGPEDTTVKPPPPEVPEPEVPQDAEPIVMPDAPQALPASATCRAQGTLPAVIETITEQMIELPATLDSDGAIVTPAVIRTQTRQQILRPREDFEFEIPCPDVVTAEFIASLQRALAARGYYNGDITAELDDATEQAIQQFQLDQGDIATPQLTLQTAQTLGLVPTPTDRL